MIRSIGRVIYGAGRAMARSLGLELAGHIAFTGLLAIFPFLIFLAALAGSLAITAAAWHRCRQCWICCLPMWARRSGR